MHRDRAGLADRRRRPVPHPVRRVRRGRHRPHVVPAALRAGRRLDPQRGAGFDREWYTSRGLAWVVRAAELGILLPVALGTTLSVTTRITGFRKVWARRRTEAFLPDGTLALWAHTDWVMTDARGLPGRVPPEFPAAFSTPPGPFEPGRVPLPADARRGRQSSRRGSGRRTSTRWATSTTPRTSTTWRRRCSQPATRRSRRCARRLAGSGSSTSRPPSRSPSCRGQRGSYDDAAGGGWAWRLTDPAGDRDITRSRVLPGS